MNRFEDFRGQSAHLKQLRAEFAGGRYVHAYLFCGPKGTGKQSAARLLAMTAMCRGENKPCGVCGPCRRAAAGTHPDIHEIAPEKDKKTIGVEVVRGVIEEVGVKSFEGGVKALICPQAEKMTAQAQNCLLKTLEEPPEKTVFFLITDQPGALLDTIVSRCRRVAFHPIEEAITEEGLSLRAQVTKDVFSVHSAADIAAVLSRYKDDREKQSRALEALEAAVRDIMLAQSGYQALAPQPYAKEAQDYARSVPLSGGIALSQAILKAKKMCGSNVTFASAFESILLKVSEEYARWRW